MLDADVIRKIRHLEITTRKRVRETLSGQYHSTFKGRGLSFSEVRAYQSGDEVRTIDWNVTARRGETHVKVFTEERELSVLLLVDVSASCDYGSSGRSKAELAAEVCAQIAFSAIHNGDRVGLVLFSDRVEKLVPPKKGRKHALRLLADVLAAKHEGPGTNLSAPLRAVTELSRHRKPAVVFLVSDFLATGYDAELQLAAARHDLVPVVLRDPAELQLPAGGLIELEDSESGRRVLIDSADPRVRQAFLEQAANDDGRLKAAFRRSGLDGVQLVAGADNTLALLRFFKGRARRRR